MMKEGDYWQLVIPSGEASPPTNVSYDRTQTLPIEPYPEETLNGRASRIGWGVRALHGGYVRATTGGS